MVKMKKSIAKWHVDHPEIYFRLDGTLPIDSNYDTEMQVFLMCLMGVPVLGKVGRPGYKCYYVDWKVAGLKLGAYFERKDFEILTLDDEFKLV